MYVRITSRRTKYLLLYFGTTWCKKEKVNKLFEPSYYLLRLTCCEIHQMNQSHFLKEETHSILHRFYGKTADGIEFAVQVKHDLKTGRKDFMSVFPLKKSQTKKVRDKK